MGMDDTPLFPELGTHQRLRPTQQSSGRAFRLTI